MDEKFKKTTHKDNSRRKGGKGGKKALIISIIVAAAICATGIVLHKNANDDMEADEYNYAIRSFEPLILSNYLSQYKDAPDEHRDAIASRLKMIEAMENQWNTAVKSNSCDSLQKFIDKYPSSKHRKEAMQMIDSLDFIKCYTADTEEAYLEYLDHHPDGAYYENAHDGLRRIRTKNVTTEENIMIGNVMRSLLLYINMNDEEGLMTIVSERMTLLDNEDATRGDMAELLRRLYKDDVKNIEWTTSSDYDISKREVGERNYEYSVIFTVKSTVTHTDDSMTESNLRVNVTVNPDDLISELKMTRILE